MSASDTSRALATTLAPHWYTSLDVYAREVERVFRRSCVRFGREDWLPNVGDYFAFSQLERAEGFERANCRLPELRAPRIHRGTLEPSYPGVMGPIALIAFGIAFAQPAATTNALAPFPKIAGSAAALLGFMQTGGGLAGSLAAALLHEPVLALATVVPAMPLIALAAHYGLGAVNTRNARRAQAIQIGGLTPGE